MSTRLSVLETERCVECQSCMFACSRRQNVAGLTKSCVRVRSIGGLERGFTIIVCRACFDPPCARACPSDALSLREGGGVILDMKKCIGCGHCLDACLIGAIQWDDTAEKPMICIHCGYCVEFPSKNLQQATHDGTANISGENFAEHYLKRRLACSHCPVGCIHIAALREPYEDEPYFYKTSMISYDYEPIYALGSMLGMKTPADFLKLMDRVEAWGLDAMTTGVVLAWATEALERKILSEKETLGVKLAWGDPAGYIQACELIIEQPNDFYQALARGVEYASSRYGGQDFALAIGGNEMPG